MEQEQVTNFNACFKITSKMLKMCLGAEKDLPPHLLAEPRVEEAPPATVRLEIGLSLFEQFVWKD